MERSECAIRAYLQAPWRHSATRFVHPWSLPPSKESRLPSSNGDDAYPWERAANLLGVPVAQIQAWISAGQLRVVDTFVTDRSFEEFCKKHGEELRELLIDAPTAKWLVSGYGVSEVRRQRRERLSVLESMRW